MLSSSAAAHLQHQRPKPLASYHAGLSGDRPLASDPAHFTTLSLADSLLSGATLTHSHWTLSGPVHSWVAQRPGAAAAGGCVDKHRPPLSLSLSLSLRHPPKHPKNKGESTWCIQQFSIMEPADLLAVPGDAPWRILYAPGSPRRSSPSWALFCLARPPARPLCDHRGRQQAPVVSHWSHISHLSLHTVSDSSPVTATTYNTPTQLPYS